MKKLTLILLAVSFNTFADLPENATKHIVKAVKVLNQKDLSCDTKNECVAVAVGAMACGGPASYIVASKNNAKLDTILNLAKTSEELDDDYNRDNGVFSICLFVSAPQMKCENNTCSAGNSRL